MNATQIQELIIGLRACKEAREWAEGKDWETIFQTCHRGDWLLRLYASVTDLTIEANLRTLTLAKGLCANTVRPQDKRLQKAIDTAIAFGKGEATREELDTAALNAATAVDDVWEATKHIISAASNRSQYSAIAAFSAVSLTDPVDTAHLVALFAANATAVYLIEQKENQVLTANIVRETIPFEKWILP
jgi:hypothetical protein